MKNLIETIEDIHNFVLSFHKEFFNLYKEKSKSGGT